MSRRAKAKHSPDARSPGRAGPGGTASLAAVQPNKRRLTFAICVLLGLAVGAVFGQTLGHGFVNYDDGDYVYENAAILHGLSWQGVIWAFTHSHADNWHPLTTLSHMLDCQVYGLHPWGHHLTSVVLHGATAILLFLMLRQMSGAMWRSAFVAAVFAIHPLRVESVAWVSERKDVLSGLFFMLTLWAYVCHVQKQGAKRQSAISFPGSGFYWLALFLFTLGLLCKPMLVTLPFVLLLLDYWPLNRLASPEAGGPGSRFPAWLGLILEKIPFLLLTVAACVATVLAQQQVIESAQTFGIATRMGNALVSYAAYVWQMVYPVGLAVFYPHPGSGLPIWRVGMSVVVLLIITAGVMVGRRKHPYLLVGWLWYLGMLVPVIGLMQVGAQARADRYTYLPQIGLYMMVTWGVVELCAGWRHRRAVLGTVAAAILGGLLGAAYVQTGYWKDSVSLWTRDLACTPENSLARCNLGGALARQGKPAEAIQQYERALQLNPDDAEAHNDLGNALTAQGKPAEAIPQYERALQLKPDDAITHCNLGNALTVQGKLAEAIQHCERALQLDPDSAQAHCNLGAALAKQGKLLEAISHYERALQLKPDYPDAHCNLGNALITEGRLAEAIQHYEQALQLKSDYPEARYNLGVALATQAKLAEAIQHFEQALQLNPDDAEAHCNLGVALARQGKLAEAMQHFEQALRLKPGYAEAHNDLAIALAGQGRSNEAIQQFQQALNLAMAQNNTALAESIRARLRFYQPALLPPQTP